MEKGKYGQIMLSETETEWLKKHFKNTLNAEICEHLGIKDTTMHRIARELGLKKSAQQMKKTQQNACNKARQEWYSLTDEERETRLKIMFNNINEHRCNRKGISNLKYYGRKKWEEMQRKCHETRNATIRKERARILFGLPQQTKMRFVRQGAHKTMARYRLVKVYGYTAEGPRVMYRPADPSRVNEVLEKRYTDKYHFIFKDYETNTDLCRQKRG